MTVGPGRYRVAGLPAPVARICRHYLAGDGNSGFARGKFLARHGDDMVVNLW
jgi:hypothetical protein